MFFLETKQQTNRFLSIKQLVILTLLLSFSFMNGQGDDDDLFAELDAISETETSDEVIAAFKSTRLMLGQSTERVRKDQLHFRISHMFGKINGIDNFFGLDDILNMHFSFEYGLTDKIQLGLIRSNKPDKTYSLSSKFTLLRQTIKSEMPISLSYYASIDIKTREYFPEERDDYFKGRLDYVNQILISRKMNDKLSLQLSPTWVHINLTDNIEDPNDVISIGVGGRYLITKSTSINVEYFRTLNRFETYDPSHDALTFGVDIETGGHVFQLFLSNAYALHPGKFAINDNPPFFNGRNINFGFSILRAFNLRK